MLGTRSIFVISLEFAAVFFPKGNPKRVAFNGFCTALFTSKLPRNKFPAAMGILTVSPNCPVLFVSNLMALLPSIPFSTETVGYSCGFRPTPVKAKPEFPEAQIYLISKQGCALCFLEKHLIFPRFIQLVMFEIILKRQIECIDNHRILFMPISVLGGYGKFPGMRIVHHSGRIGRNVCPFRQDHL